MTMASLVRQRRDSLGHTPGSNDKRLVYGLGGFPVPFSVFVTYIHHTKWREPYDYE